MSIKNYTEIAELSERIKKIRGDASVKAFATQLGVSAAYIYALESGEKTAISETLAELISTKYNYERQWVLTGKGSMLRASFEQQSAESPQCGRMVSVFALAGAGTPKELVEHDPITTISIPEDFYSASIVPVKIRGRSMEPIIYDGAFIGVDRADRQVVSGEIYAIWMPHEGAIVKRLFMELDKVLIKSDNRDFHSFSIPFKELENGAYGDEFILGRVKWVIQRLPS